MVLIDCPPMEEVAQYNSNHLPPSGHTFVSRLLFDAARENVVSSLLLMFVLCLPVLAAKEIELDESRASVIG